jgi:hypothetical protein
MGDTVRALMPCAEDFVLVRYFHHHHAAIALYLLLGLSMSFQVSATISVKYVLCWRP